MYQAPQLHTASRGSFTASLVSRKVPNGTKVKEEAGLGLSRRNSGAESNRNKKTTDIDDVQ